MAKIAAGEEAEQRLVEKDSPVPPVLEGVAKIVVNCLRAKGPRGNRPAKVPPFRD